MILSRFFRDRRGSSSVEFSITAPVFFAMVFGFLLLALWLWAAFALQHGVEFAARCAAMNKTTCGTASAIQAYGASHAYGLPVTASNFTYTAASCGYQVTGTFSSFNGLGVYRFPLMTVRAQACHP